MGKAPVLNSGLGSVFQEEGPASALGADSLSNMQLQSLMKRFPQMSREKALKGLGLGGLPQATQNRIGMPTDITRPIDLKSALRELRAVERPQASSQMPSIDDIMSADPSVFDLEGPEMPKPKVIPKSPDDAVELVRQQKKAQSTEDFRAKEAEIAKDMMPEMGGDPKDVQKALDDTLKTAMSDYISNVRGSGPETKEMSLDDYKKEFADATGIDISGKVDKSQALMAVGLALMQSRMGKGFNVAKILGTIGAAGQQALPILKEAKDSAKANILAAGKYALEQRAGDRAADEQAREAMMNRQGYYIYPKGKDGNFSNFDDGQIVRLNKYEMNKLMQDGDFGNQYDFIEASQYLDVLKERSQQPDYGDKFTSPTDVSLIGQKEGSPEIFTVRAQLPDGNYKGAKPEYGHLQTNADAVQLNIINEQKAILREAAKFEELAGLIEEGISIPEQVGSAITTFGRNLGLDWGDGPTSIKRAKTALKRIQTTNAKDILGEVGKTLSDTDRQIVKDVVGDINWAEADAELVLEKLGEVYKLVIDKRQENVNTAIKNLDNQFGIKFRIEDFVVDNDDMSEEDMLAEVNEMRKRQGLEPRN